MSKFTKEDENIIIEACNTDRKTFKRSKGLFTYKLKSEYYKIMYGSTEDLANRVKTLPFLYNAPQKPNKIRVPELVHHFDDGCRTYLVMELIEFTEVSHSESDMENRIKDVLIWLSTFVSTQLGPLGGGCILHKFFNEGEAPLPFVSVKALELYIEKVRVKVLIPSLTHSWLPHSLSFISLTLYIWNQGTNKDLRPQQELESGQFAGRTDRARTS